MHRVQVKSEAEKAAAAHTRAEQDGLERDSNLVEPGSQMNSEFSQTNVSAAFGLFSFFSLCGFFVLAHLHVSARDCNRVQLEETCEMAVEAQRSPCPFDSHCKAQAEREKTLKEAQETIQKAEVGSVSGFSTLQQFFAFETEHKDFEYWK